MDEADLDNEGLEFTSTLDGVRRYCMRTQCYGSLLLVWFIRMFSNGGSRTDTEWRVYLSIVVAFLIGLAILYHVRPPARLQFRLRIAGDSVSLKTINKETVIPNATIRKIEIAESWGGGEYVVNIWTVDYRRYLLANPTKLKQLKEWADSLVVRERVQVTHYVSWFLTFEPVSTLACILIPLAVLSPLFVVC
mgnify:CR=1 FL=1